MTARILPFVRAEHAGGVSPAVPSDAGPHPLDGGPVAAPHLVAGVGSGRVRRLNSVSQTSQPAAPTTALGNPVVGAKLGPAGVPLPRNTRPGHHDGPGAA